MLARHLFVLAVVLGCGCWQGLPEAPPPVARAPAPVSVQYALSAEGLGPIRSGTRPTLSWLRKHFPGHRIERRERDGIVVYDALLDRERMFFVSVEDPAVFVLSPRIRITGTAWRVGERLPDTAGLDHCSCWGAMDWTVCSRAGEHLRVAFALDCTRPEIDGPRAVVGAPVASVAWTLSTENAEQREGLLP